MKNFCRVFCFCAVATCCVWSVSCNKSADQSAQSTESGSDPAQANLAEPTSQAPAPVSSQPSQQAYSQPPAAPAPEQSYGPAPEETDTSEPVVEAPDPPPPLPEYSQPEAPGPNYLWNPGYWGYASAGYYWVPGIWVVAPYVGALWTPPYWGYVGNRYRWHHGFWGSHIGFYGGINYGFGYVGRGYEGGYWNRGEFFYNRSVNHVNTTIIHNVYNYRVTNITNVRVSYEGGRGGLNVRPTAAELAVVHEQRIAPLPSQVAHMHQAEANRAQFASLNKGRPEKLVAEAPLATAYRAPAPHPAAVPGARILPRAAAPREEPGRPATVNARPEERAAPAAKPMERPAAARPATRPAPSERPAERARPATPSRPAEARPEGRPAEQPRPVARPEARPAEPPRPEVRPAARPTAEPRQEQRPHEQPRAEQRPAPESHQEARPAARPEAKPEKEAPKKDNEHPH